MELLVVYL